MTDKRQPAPDPAESARYQRDVKNWIKAERQPAPDPIWDTPPKDIEAAIRNDATIYMLEEEIAELDRIMGFRQAEGVDERGRVVWVRGPGRIRRAAARVVRRFGEAFRRLADFPD